MGNVKYYYGREIGTGHPKVTVCLIRGDKGFYRGISICSNSEKSINKIKGKHMASGRALKAMYNMESSMPVTRSIAIDVLMKCRSVSGFAIPVMKSECHPELTAFEKKLFREE